VVGGDELAIRGTVLVVGDGNVGGRVSAIGVVYISCDPSWRVLVGKKIGSVMAAYVSPCPVRRRRSSAVRLGGVGSVAASGCCVSGNSSASKAPLCVPGRVSSRAAPGPEAMPGSSVHTGQVDDGGFSGGVVIARRRQPQTGKDPSTEVYKVNRQDKTRRQPQSWRQEGK